MLGCELAEKIDQMAANARLAGRQTFGMDSMRFSLVRESEMGVGLFALTSRYDLTPSVVAGRLVVGMPASPNRLVSHR